jgi:two-component system, chemotaxis family, CheB/CheR fusion protein
LNPEKDISAAGPKIAEAQEHAKEKVDEDFEALLRYLKNSRGSDFTGYKRQSLMRRVRRRMQSVNIRSFSGYKDYLEAHTGEFSSLFNTILINVTSFFRDKSTWEYLEREIIPKIISSKKEDEIIRIWSAGCATGEEAYSIAILMAEALGAEAYLRRVKIFATDIDDSALAQARAASYPAKDLDSMNPKIREKYFDLSGESYVFKPDLRKAIIFGRHDLLQDAPISHLELLLCRNTLMYFNADAQGRILARFNFALNDSGYLFLGRAELLLTHPHIFAPANLKCRVFIKVPKPQGPPPDHLPGRGL